MIDTQGAVYKIENADTGEIQKVYISLDEDETAIIGDKINKANMLPDEVVEALGLTMENPQVKDALLARASKYVVDTGTSNGWSYEKYSDGTCKATKILNPTTAIATASTTGMYRTNTNLTESLPNGLFKAITYYSTHFCVGNVGAGSWFYANILNCSTTVLTYRLWCNYSQASISLYLPTVVEGTWK